MRTESENGFGVNEKVANEKLDVNIDRESMWEGIVGGLSVNVAMNLEVAVDGITVYECWHK